MSLKLALSQEYFLLSERVDLLVVGRLSIHTYNEYIIRLYLMSFFMSCDLLPLFITSIPSNCGDDF